MGNKKKEDMLGVFLYKTVTIQGGSSSVGQLLTNLDHGRGCADMTEDKHEVLSAKKVVETLDHTHCDCL